MGSGKRAEATVMDEHIATIWFIDGVWRPVYEGTDARQYVIDGGGEKVYGVWFFPPDEPAPTFIINAAAHR
jgi:hypothetical protein